MGVHEVDVRMSLGKRVPVGRFIQEMLYRIYTMDPVHPVREVWKVVIFEVRHEEQAFASWSR
jgi:hypothetical protein